MVQCGLRAVLQISLTGATLITAITAFTFAFVFEKFMDQLNENFRAELSSVNLPCIRSTLPQCDNALVDKCWDYCCPAGYACARSPIVSLYCRDGTVTCGNHNWCRDFADIPKSCGTEVCQTHHMVMRVTSWSYVLASMGIILDLVDIITIFTLPDAVIFKSGVNIFAALVKMIAFGIVLGGNTQSFMSELEAARCFNAEGQQLVADAGGMFVSYLIVQVLSAVLSLILAPFSAYYGGKLQGVPYVK
mmetsp:Transcript_5250/g.14855  ORF Transcript_5250/g.14855 Transcript_5250/m.14855 type:complete len:247 (-) Transcript_5250:236-976(-)